MNVHIAFPPFTSYRERIRERLGAPIHVEFDALDTEEARQRYLPETDILIINRFPAAYGPLCPRLRFLQVAGAGVDKIDFRAIAAGVRVCNVYGHGPSIAEYVVMAMLALSRRLYEADRKLRGGIWLNPQVDPSVPLFEPLSGKSALVLGTGEIGRCVAERIRPFGVRLVGVNRTGRPAGDAFHEIHPLKRLPGLLPDADFLVLALPLTDETRGLIGPTELAALKTAAFVINVARGPVVDEAALYESLKAGRPAGAALDVWYKYPEPGSNTVAPSRYPFHTLDSVLMTPHISGMARSTFDHRVELILGNIKAFIADAPLQNEIATDSLRGAGLGAPINPELLKRSDLDRRCSSL